MKLVSKVWFAAFLLAAGLSLPSAAQAQLGSTAIVQGGNIANVTAGHALQVDVTSVAGTNVSGQVAGSVPVTIVSGAGSGGTASADEATFTPGTTNGTLENCFFQTTASNNALTNLQGGTVQCTARRALFTSLDAWAGTTLGAPANFGTTPGAVTAGSVNASTFIGTVAAVAAASGVQKVGISGNSGVSLDAATGAAPPANALLLAGLGSGATGGFLIGVPVADTTKSVNIASATTTLLVTGVAGRQVRIGSFELETGGANNLEWIEGTGATCGTGTAGMSGGTTSGLGYSFLANGYIQRGSGFGTVLSTATAGDSVCMVTSTSAQVSGNLQYTIY